MPSKKQTYHSAGDGTVGAKRGIPLKCGHSTTDKPATEGTKVMYFCPEGCGLREAK